MKLYVTRHGQTQYNIEVRICGRANVRLTEKGISQAHELAQSMQDTDVDLIIHHRLCVQRRLQILSVQRSVCR